MESYQVSSLRHQYDALVLVANGLLNAIREQRVCNILTVARMAQQARDAARELASMIERMIYNQKKTAQPSYPKNVVQFETLKKPAKEKEEERKPGLMGKLALFCMLVLLKIFIGVTYVAEINCILKSRKKVKKLSRVVRYSKIGYIYSHPVQNERLSTWTEHPKKLVCR